MQKVDIKAIVKIWIKLNKQSIIITVKDWLKLNIWEYSSVGRAIDC